MPGAAEVLGAGAFLECGDLFLRFGEVGLPDGHLVPHRLRETRKRAARYTGLDRSPHGRGGFLLRLA